MTALILSLLFAQTTYPGTVGPYTQLGARAPNALLDGGIILRGALIMTTDGGPAQPAVYDGRNWTDMVSATTTPMNLYVNADGGVDTNDCGTAGTACATIQAAVDRIPYWVRHQVTVNVEAGTYTGNVIVSGRRIGPWSATGISSSAGYVYPSITIQGSNSWTAPAITGGNSGTLTGYTGPSVGVEGALADGAKAWTPVLGVTTRFVRMTSGVASGQRSVVTSNSANTLYINRPLTGAAIGDTYQIEVPSTTIVGRIVVENITGDPDAQSTAVLFSRLNVTDSGAAATNDPWIAIRNVPRVSNHNSIAGATSADFEVYRPTAAVAFSECFVPLAGGSISILCQQGSCAFRGPNMVTSSAYWTLSAKDADLDLGAVYLTNGYSTNGRALVLDTVRLQAGLYTQTTGLIESALSLEPLFPVVESNGSSGYAIDGTYVTSTMNAIMLRGGRSTGAPDSYCMKLKQSSVSMTYYSCLALLGLSGFQPAYGMWLTDRTFALFNSVTASVSNTTLRVEYGSRVHSVAAPPTAGGTADLRLDGTVYSFATIDALTPRYVEGVMGSQYVRQ